MSRISLEYTLYQEKTTRNLTGTDLSVTTEREILSPGQYILENGSLNLPIQVYPEFVSLCLSQFSGEGGDLEIFDPCFNGGSEEEMDVNNVSTVQFTMEQLLSSSRDSETPPDIIGICSLVRELVVNDTLQEVEVSLVLKKK